MKLDGRLFAGRAKALEYFLESINNSDLKNKTELDVAVLGGGKNEFECQALINMGFNLRINSFNVSGDCDFLIDLNLDSQKLPEAKYDLIVCSQVLEHLWNVQNAILVMKQLAKFQGYIYLNVPFSNKVHRDLVSDFCTPGYSSTYLSSNFNKLGLSVLRSIDFGNRRLYNCIHYLQYWPLEQEFKGMKIQGNRSRQNFRIIRFIRKLWSSIRIFRWNSSWEEYSQFSTESVIFARHDQSSV